MGRSRARLYAVVVVLGVTVAAAYASLAVTPNPTAHSNNYITPSNPGRLIFSIRNTNATAITINGFSPVMPAATTDCANINLPARLDGITTPATLAPGEQMQYIATTTAGWPMIGTYSCTWNILSDDPGGPYTIETLFQVGSAAGSADLDAQPFAIDFGSQSVGDIEVQKVMISNYTSPRGVVLSIIGDLGAKDITFADAIGSCLTGTTNCMIGLPPGPNFVTVNLRCAPQETNDVNAQLVISPMGSGAIATVNLHCNAAGADIIIADNPIQITAPVNTVGMTTTTITSPSLCAQLGSATISSFPFDPSFKISNCGASSCAFGGQALPFPLTVECLTAATQKNGTLTVWSTSGGSATSQVRCTGTGTTPVMELGPIPTFGAVRVGDFNEQMIEVKNTGGSQLNGLVITFTNTQDWLTLDCASNPGCSIPAGTSLFVRVRFRPLAIFDRSTMMHLTSTNAGMLSAPVMGTGLGGRMVVTDPASLVLDLGSIPRGAPYSRTITLANTGNFPYSATHAGASSPYTVTPAMVSVSTTQPEMLTVVCQSPTATPTNNEQHLNITSADAFSGSPIDVTLRCKVEDTVVSVMPTPLDFGEVRVGTGTRTIPVTVTNPASAPIAAHITKLALRTAIPGLSLSPPNTDIVLQPGQSTIATLELSDAMDTTLTDEYLDIDVDAAQLQLPVTGKVVTPHSRVTPQRLDLGTACVGTGVSGTVMLFNDGTATLAVDPPQMDQNFVASSPGTPTQLSPNMSLSAAVSPAMTAMGLVEGQLSWHEDSEYTHLIPVSLEYVSTGTALSPKGLDFGILDAGNESDPQHITLQNCDPTNARIKVEALRTKQGALAAWSIEPRIGYTKDLRGLEIQAIDVRFKPPARGRYEADLEVSTPAGPQKIHLVGEATGRDYDVTSFYACACSGGGAPSRGWPVPAALAVVILWRRRPRAARARRVIP